MRKLLLLVCVLTTSIANAIDHAPKKRVERRADVVSETGRTANSEAALTEAHAAWQIQNDALREKEKAEINSVKKDKTLDSFKKKEAIELVSNKYAEKRRVIRQQINTDLRIRLMGMPRVDR